jgi:hypothetical protein
MVSRHTWLLPGLQGNGPEELKAELEQEQLGQEDI